MPVTEYWEKGGGGETDIPVMFEPSELPVRVKVPPVTGDWVVDAGVVVTMSPWLVCTVHVMAGVLTVSVESPNVTVPENVPETNSE